uniref:Troponin n=1 Tax=Steinernema glaseri TaxID=37863 RepID=A0A1I8A0M2_9BILA
MDNYYAAPGICIITPGPAFIGLTEGTPDSIKSDFVSIPRAAGYSIFADVERALESSFREGYLLTSQVLIHTSPVSDPCRRDIAMQSDDDKESKRDAERERKKAEVRKRLEEAGRAKKAKKGFLTPERKKKLRKLLLLKAAEDLKREQMLREQERQRTLHERIMPIPDLDALDEEEIKATAQQMIERVKQLESDCYDINYTVRQKDFEINELTIAVNDLRGKFVKPTLKKVSKTQGKFDKLKKKEGGKVDFRSNLKTVDTNKFALEEEKGKEKADWAK